MTSPAPPDMGALAERMIPLAQEFACLIRDEDAGAIGAFLATFTRQELYGVLVVTAAMADISRPVSELLAWVTWDDPVPAVRLAEAPAGKGRKPQPCGTSAAYQRHIAHGQKPCTPCREARSATDAAGHQRRKQRRGGQREAAPAGSEAAA